MIMHDRLQLAKPLAALSLLCTLVAYTAPAAAVPFNVALGKPVTISGDYGVISPEGLTAGWGDSTTFPPAALSTVTDGTYLPEGTHWQQGTVWWDERNAGSANNIIEIDLQGLFRIELLSIQADNNDQYQINYRNADGVWIGYGIFNPFGGAGMRERSGILAPFEATAIQIDALGGDGYYAVSEFQARGESVPEPGTLSLLAFGLSGLLLRRRRLN
jgi:hypothetical protein